MNNDTFLIENYDIELAQDTCSAILEPDTRNKAVASVLGAKIAKKYFTEIEIDTDTGLHNIPQVQEKIEISDIYLRNNYIDVRVYFNEDELSVPKSHFDKETLPLAYMFIKLSEDISSAIVTGFIMPTTINTNVDYNGYYKINEKDLISYYDVEALITEGFTYDIDNDIICEMFNYLNETIEDDGHFLRTLIASKDAREKFINTAKTNRIFNLISSTEANNETELEAEAEAVAVVDVENNTEINDIETIEELSFVEDDSLISETGDFELAEHFDNETLDEVIPYEDIENTDLENSFDEDITNDESFDLIQEVTNEDNELISVSNDTYLLEEQEITTDSSQEEVIEQDELDSVNYSNAETIIDDQANIEPEIKDEINDVINSENINELILTDEDSDTEIEQDEYILEDAIEELNINNEIVKNDTAEISNNFEYTTEITPSINAYEEVDITEEDLENSEDIADDSDKTIEDSASDASEQIDTLFGEEDTENNEEQVETYNDDGNEVVVTKKSNLIPMLGIITVVAALGYFAYTKFAPNEQQKLPQQNTNVIETSQKSINSNIKEDAMPVESVENKKSIQLSNEGTAESIPAIEQNLDASILISNLRVAWEVPVSYTSNATAKRYFTRLGKIIQLNLKTEMLLLSKPPITNKILVELEFNKTSQKFDVKGITVSSGETAVDELILKTVKNSLDINLNMNLNSLGNIQGNPTLIINL